MHGNNENLTGTCKYFDTGVSITHRDVAWANRRSGTNHGQLLWTTFSYRHKREGNVS